MTVSPSAGLEIVPILAAYADACTKNEKKLIKCVNKEEGLFILVNKVNPIVHFLLSLFLAAPYKKSDVSYTHISDSLTSMKLKEFTGTQTESARGLNLLLKKIGRRVETTTKDRLSKIYEFMTQVFPSLDPKYEMLENETPRTPSSLDGITFPNVLPGLNKVATRGAALKMSEKDTLDLYASTS
jgi:hypothetical protein